MSNKSSSICRSVVRREPKCVIESSKQPVANQRESGTINTPEQKTEKVASFEDCSTLIEVTVRTKGHKRTAAMVSSSPRAQKAGEEKKKFSSNTETPQSWGQILREGNCMAIKQGLHDLVFKTDNPKMVKQKAESKNVKEIQKEKQKQSLKHTKTSMKGSMEVPSKQVPVARKSETRGRILSTADEQTAAVATTQVESVLVVDRRIQCDGFADYSDNMFNDYPLQTLNFLMKELKHRITDSKANKLLNEMEQVLRKMPADHSKSSPMQDPEAATYLTKLQTCITQLEERSKEMNAMCESLREERSTLQRELHRQITLQNEHRERASHLENTVKQLQMELDEAKKSVQVKEKMIANLKEEIKNSVYSQKVIEDLRANLKEQTDLAREKQSEVQYLTLERDKLSVLSSYKDTLLMEFRKSMKDLQDHIASQLTGLKNVYTHTNETINAEMSLVQRGMACSSPNSTSSHESNVPNSWHDVSDISLSTVEHDAEKKDGSKAFLQKREKVMQSSKKAYDHVEKKRAKTTKELKANSIQLEFISLPGGEISTTVLPSYRDVTATEPGQLVGKGKEEFELCDKKENKPCMANNGQLASEKLIFGNQSSTNRRADIQKSLLSSDNKSDDKPAVSKESSHILKANFPTKLVGPSITEQFQHIFEGIRHQSRMPVELPSPPRNYPHPDLTHSTLPSISAMSELNGMYSSDT